MAYSDIQKAYGTFGPTAGTLGVDLSTTAGQTTGLLGAWAYTRTATLIGFGTLCMKAAITKTTNPIIAASRAPYAAGGVTFADLAGWTMTLGLNAATPRGLDLGAVTEVSSLIKAIDPQTAAAPVLPNAYIAPVDLAPGDVVSVYIKTAASYTTEPLAVAYILVASRGAF